MLAKIVASQVGLVNLEPNTGVGEATSAVCHSRTRLRMAYGTAIQIEPGHEAAHVTGRGRVNNGPDCL